LNFAGFRAIHIFGQILGGEKNGHNFAVSGPILIIFGMEA